MKESSLGDGEMVLRDLALRWLVQRQLEQHLVCGRTVGGLAPVHITPFLPDEFLPQRGMCRLCCSPSPKCVCVYALAYTYVCLLVYDCVSPLSFHSLPPLLPHRVVAEQRRPAHRGQPKKHSHIPAAPLLLSQDPRRPCVVVTGQGGSLLWPPGPVLVPCVSQ